jgi:simple sugar transport system ATP-binding protein
MVFQHFSLFDTLTVAENVWLGLDKSMPLAEVTRRITTAAITAGGGPAAPGAHAVGGRDAARGNHPRPADQPALLILDEPTSVLTPQAVEKLFVVLRRLAAKAAPSSTSATSCTKSASCARPARCCAAVW